MRIRPVHSVAIGLTALVVAAPLVAAPAAHAADTDITINEVESAGGTPGDWIELYNAGTTPVDVSGWVVKDSDDSRTAAIPAGSTIPSGGYYVIEETVLGFGLGGNDAARIYLPDGTTLIDSYAWTTSATTTYGRNPDGTGAFATTTASTKGSANDFSPPVVVPPPATLPPVVVNEVESNGGTPGDWIELGNTGQSTVDVSGYILRDDNPGNAPLVLPANTTIESGGYLTVDTEPTFGLGNGDTAGFYAPDGTTVIDSYTWTTHATTTYGRCPDLTGAFTTTAASTRGLRNACGSTTTPVPATTPWPGSPDVRTVDLEQTFGEDLSGLAYEARQAGDILWAVENGTGTLYRLIFDGVTWVPDAGGWADGATLRYPDGTGVVDAEGVALTGAGSADGIYVSSERNNDASAVSRPSVLRYDVSDASGDLVATREWNLAADLPGLRANGGLEGIAWIADADLVSGGFIDQSTGAAYSPATYPGHGGGLFFVGVETDANVYAYALRDDGGYARVATIASGFELVAELEYDTATDTLLVVCDQACDGRITAFRLAGGIFAPTVTYARPAGMANLANEGFALASACVGGSRAAYWADDAGTGGFSLRAGTFACAASADPTDPPAAVAGSGRELAETGSNAEPGLALAIALTILGLGAIGAARRRARAR